MTRPGKRNCLLYVATTVRVGLVFIAPRRAIKDIKPNINQSKWYPRLKNGVDHKIKLYPFVDYIINKYD